MCKILDGKALALKIKNQVMVEVDNLYSTYAKETTLAVIIVGENPASQIYVKNKIKDCQEVHIKSLSYTLPDSTTQQQINSLVSELATNNSVDGILVQLPLPKHLNEAEVLALIPPSKDVDGFTEQNVGKLLLFKNTLYSCTPYGVMQLLEEYKVDIAGKNAVVIGRSNIVGKPMAMMLLEKSATVTICHSRTQNLKEFTKNADILIVAIGRAKFVTADMVKPGAVVVDVGMDRDENGKLCGDVDFVNVKEVAGMITPVPGGVGPMTRAMLMKNTVVASKRNVNGI